MWQLFRCYQTCLVAEFKKLISNLKLNHDYHGNFTPEELIAKVAKAHNNLHLDNRQATEDPKIITSSSIIEKMKEVATNVALS